MTTEKKDIEIDIDKEIENILQLGIGEIDKKLIYSKYKFDEQNFPNFLDKVSDHFSPMDDNFYSDDSNWTEFFKSKIIEWFGEEHGLVKIDDDFWLLSNVLNSDGIRFWDFSRIDTDDIERAKKLVKLMSITEDIGDEVNKIEIDNIKIGDEQKWQ